VFALGLNTKHKHAQNFCFPKIWTFCLNHFGVNSERPTQPVYYPPMSMSQFMKSSPAPSPILVDCREAARLLSISPRTLWHLTNDGEIPSLKIGKKCVRYRLIDLDAWTQKQVERQNEQLNEVNNGQH
jgi:excisionase family DNA binding protein